MRIVLALFILSCFGYTQNNVYYYRDHRIGLAVEPGTPPVQGDYYVDAVSGNDANDGLTTGTAWKTLDKVSGESFVPGDTILFNRGDTFQGTLTISSSGSSDDPIVYAAYGTGANPIITSRDSVSGWSNGSNWGNYAANKWAIGLATTYPIERVWIDGSEVLLTENSDRMNADTLASHWFDADSLYIYSVGNPAVTYSLIEYAGSSEYTIYITDADYVTVENLDLRGGNYGTVGIEGSDYLIIQSCDIGKSANHSGIMSNGAYIGATDMTSDHVTIDNNTIYSEWTFPYVYYDASTPYGIFNSRGDYWEITNNYIRDWWFCIYISGGEASSPNSGRFNTIANNDLTSPDFSFCKGIQIYTNGTESNGHSMWTDVYNNYIHNVKATGIYSATDGNKFYYNILDSILCTDNVEKDPTCSNSGMGIDFNAEGGGNLDSNYVFNNTFYRCDRGAIWWFESFTYNNLFLNINMNVALPNAVTIDADLTGGDYQNNLFYRTSSTSSDYFVYESPTGYTVSGFNGLSEASGNIYPVSNSSVAEIMNADFTLPSGSEALNAGVDIDALLPDGFTDRESNVVNQSAPNIGAIDNTP